MPFAAPRVFRKRLLLARGELVSECGAGLGNSMDSLPAKTRAGKIRDRSGLDQVSHEVDVASCGSGIRTRLVRYVHQGLGDFLVQTRQVDVEANLEGIGTVG